MSGEVRGQSGEGSVFIKMRRKRQCLHYNETEEDKAGLEQTGKEDTF